MNDFQDHDYSQCFTEILARGWIASCDWQDEVDSTNNLLKRTVENGDLPRLPHLKVASRQTAGRGQRSNSWWTPAGALAFSLLCTDASIPVSRDRLPQLALVAAIAVADTLDETISAPAQLKWPNDVYVAGKKICGILIETLSRDRELFLIIGVGINVAVPVESAPESLRQLVTSAHLHAMRPPNPQELLLRFAVKWANAVDAWSQQPEFITQNFRHRDLLVDRLIEVQSGSDCVIGRSLGIERDGSLLLQTGDGSKRKFRSGTVRIVPSS